MPKLGRMMCAVAMGRGCFTPDRDALYAQRVQERRSQLGGGDAPPGEGGSSEKTYEGYESYETYDFSGVLRFIGFQGPGPNL